MTSSDTSMLRWPTRINKLYELNERLKDGLKKTKEKLIHLQSSVKDIGDLDKEKCKACGCDLYMGFTQNTPNNINISANNSSFKIRIDNDRKDIKYIKRKRRTEARSSLK